MILTLFMMVVLLAFLFGVINGFIDGGGLVSTVIITRVMEPVSALLLVAAGEVAGLFVLGQAVSHLLGRHMIILPTGAPVWIVLSVLICALLGALIWNTSMWWMALPSSSGHALVGGIAGAAVAGFGYQGISWPVFLRVFIFLGVVPIAAGFLSLVFSKFTYWLGEFLTPSTHYALRTLLIVALGGVAMAHGSNDGQKSMAMILLALVAVGLHSAGLTWLPWSLTLFCGVALAVGVILGSRRTLATLGKGLYRIQALQGFCAEMSTMVLVGLSSLWGYPMSTTQVMASSVLGAGVAVQPRGVRWDLVGDIGLAWLITIPASAVLSGSAMLLIKGLVHVVS